MILLDMDIDFSRIDDDKLPLVILKNFDGLLRFVNTSDKFECNLILKVDSKMCQKENTFLDDSHIGLKDKLIFESRIDILQKLFFLIIF